MKLYKEMLRKLAVVGLPLLAVTMVYTLVKGGVDCFGAYHIMQSKSAVSQVIILRYYVFTGILFAFYGFSFLFSRPGSDVYHSLPVKRTDMYVSILLATATWMGATIVLNELEMLFLYLISGCPFVPVYFPLSALYYFVASMLVFAAAAVGCAVSGTIVTAIASTGIVLLFPRYVQFLFARGIVERVPIIGWLDFGAMLDPSTNAATGILTMHLRDVYNGQLITLPHILYSLIPMLITLWLGMWLFRRRPSEIAQKNGTYRVWTIITAVLLAFVVMLPVTMNYQRLFSMYGAMLMMAALGVFIVYQIIVSTKFKKALVTLPFFLIAVLGVLGFSALVDKSADQMLNTVPDTAQVESVTFRGFDDKRGDPAYSTLLTGKIAFSDEETINYVVQALQEAVDDLQSDPDYYEYNRYAAVEPIEIKLSGGRTIKRTIEFENINDLNALRMKNIEFDKAVRTFPPLTSMQFVSVDSTFTPEEEQAILESYINESIENGLLSGNYYRDRTIDVLPSGNYVAQGENQILTGIDATGYTGGQRYSDSYSLRLQTSKTAGLLMKTCNSYVTDTPVEEIKKIIARFSDGLNADKDDLSFNLTIYNFVDSDGLTLQDNVNFYINRYVADSKYRYDTLQLEYLGKFVDILAGTELTDDSDGLFMRLSWSYYEEDEPLDEKTYRRPTVYLRFTDETTEEEFMTLLKDWETTQRTL